MGTDEVTQTPPARRPPRHLTRKQLILLLPFAGIALAVVLHLAQWVTSWIATALARSRGVATTCTDLISQAGTGRDALGTDGTGVPDIDIVDYAPWGYRCEAHLDSGGVSIQDHTAGTSVLYVLTLAIAALSLVVLIGLLSAFVLTRAARALQSQGNAERPRSPWPLRLIGLGAGLLPMTMFGQYIQWYSASNSGGSSICPSTVGGDEVSGFSVTASYLPPSLTCNGDTVTGEAFSVTQHGLASYGFFGCLALIMFGTLLVIAGRVAAHRR